MPCDRIDLWRAVMADRIYLVVGCDPAPEVLPVEHLAFRLRVEERHDRFVRARLVEAENGKRMLREGQRGERDAAAEHVATGEGSIHGLCFRKCQARSDPRDPRTHLCAAP